MTDAWRQIVVSHVKLHCCRYICIYELRKTLKHSKENTHSNIHGSYTHSSTQKARSAYCTLTIQVLFEEVTMAYSLGKRSFDHSVEAYVGD